LETTNVKATSWDRHGFVGKREFNFRILKDCSSELIRDNFECHLEDGTTFFANYVSSTEDYTDFTCLITSNQHRNVTIWYRDPGTGLAIQISENWIFMTF